MGHTNRPPSRQLYGSLIGFLESHAVDADEVTLSFAEIEQLIDRPLSVSAQVAPSYWTSRAFRDGLPARLRAIGWRAHLRVKQHVVAFGRTDTAVPEG